MSQVITKRVRVSRRAFLKGVTLAGRPIAGRAAAAGDHVQLARAPRMRAERGRESREKADREPVRLLVQRQRHPRALLDSEPRPARDYRPDAVPLAAGAVPQRYPRPQRPGQSAAAAPGPGNGHHKSMSG